MRELYFNCNLPCTRFAGDCPTNPAAVQPVLSAEEICATALQHGSQWRTVAGASALIEQSYHGDTSKLAEANELLESALQRPVHKFRAMALSATMPLHYARSERREPYQDELAVVADNLRTHMQTCIDVISLEPKQFQLATAVLQAEKAERVRSMAIGAAGELAVLYAGRHLPLFASSIREDSPTSPGVTAHYGRRVHDCHTFTSDNPSSRKLLSVKTTRDPAQLAPMPEFPVGHVGLLQESDIIQQQLLPTGSRFEISDVLKALVASGKGHGRRYRFGVAYDTALRARIETIVHATPGSEQA